MSKEKTNEHALKRLLKDLHPVEAAMLRERVLTITELTISDLQKNPAAYANPIVHPGSYLTLAEKIYRMLGFEGGEITPEQEQEIKTARESIDKWEAERE